jgi:hypothetical protein
MHNIWGGIKHMNKAIVEIFGKNYLDMTFEEYKKKGVDVA